MAELLRRWVEDEGVHLASRNLDQALADGRAIGELLKKRGVLDEGEELDDRHTKDAASRNFSKLRPALKRIGVHIDAATASAVMNCERGAGARLLYAIKAASDGSTLDASQGKGSTTPLARRRHKQASQEAFERSLRKQLPGKVATLEEATRRKFEARGEAFQREAIEAEEREEIERAQRVESFREERLSSLRERRAAREEAERLGREEHERVMAKQEEAERSDLRAELASAAKARAAAQRKEEKRRREAFDGMEEFEQVLRASGRDDEAEPVRGQIPPELVTTGKSKEESLRELTSEGLDGGRSQHAVKESPPRGWSERRRKARTRRALADMEARMNREGDKGREAVVEDALAKEAEEERKLAERIHAARAEREAMRERRAEREAEEEARREREWEEALQTERIALARERIEYEQAAHEAQEYRRMRKEQEEADRKRVVQGECSQAVWGLIRLAEKCCEWRASSETLVPRHEWSNWVASFISGSDEEGAQGEWNEEQPCPADERALREYLRGEGEWAPQEGQGHGENEHVANAFQDLLEMVIGPAREHQHSSIFPHADLRAAFVGTPFSGHAAAAHRVASSFGFEVITPDRAADQAERRAEDPSASAGEQEAGAEIARAKREGYDVPEWAIARAIAEAMRRVESGMPALEGGTQEKRASGSSRKKQAETTSSSSSTKNNKTKKRSEHPEEKPFSGMLILDFPRTAREAEALEFELTGLDLDRARQLRRAASRVYPPPPGRLADPDEPFVSGLDALFIGQPCEQVELRRAMGRRLDPQTGREFHVEYTPPPDDEPGLAQRLIEPPGDEVLEGEAHSRIDKAFAEMEGLRQWVCKFEGLAHELPAEEAGDNVAARADELAKLLAQRKRGALDARNAAEEAELAEAEARRAREREEQCIQEADRLAEEMVRLRKAAEDAKGETKGQASAETVSAQQEKLVAQEQAEWEDAKSKARKGAEETEQHAREARTKAQEAEEKAARIYEGQNLTGEARRLAEEARQRASESVSRVEEELNKAEKEREKHSQRQRQREEQQFQEDEEREDRKKGNKPKKKSGAASEDHKDKKPSTAQQQHQQQRQESEADQRSEVEGDGVAQEDEESNHQKSEKVIKAWRESVEEAYVRGVRSIMAHVREGREELANHYDTWRRWLSGKMREGWREKAEEVRKVQEWVNDVCQRQWRKDDSMKAEHALRVEELRDSLWDSCDSRLDSWNKHVSGMENAQFLPSHLSRSSWLFASLCQLELDRHHAAVALVRAKSGLDHQGRLGDFMPARHDVLPKPRTQPSLDKNAPQWLQEAKEACPEATQAAHLARQSKAAPSDDDPPGVARECEALEERLLAVISVAASHASEAQQLAKRVSSQLRNAAKRRHHAECSAVASAASLLRSAIDSGEPVRAGLDFLPDAFLVVNQANPALPLPEPPSRVPMDGATARARHVAAAGAALRRVSGPFECPITCSKAAEALAAASLDDGGAGLPTSLASASVAELECVCARLCPPGSGHLYWPALLGVVAGMALPELLAGGAEEVAKARQAMQSADGDGDGSLTRQEWLGLELWYTRGERGQAVHAALFDGLSAGDGTVRWKEALLCALSLGVGLECAIDNGLAASEGHVEPAVAPLGKDVAARFAMLPRGAWEAAPTRASSAKGVPSSSEPSPWLLFRWRDLSQALRDLHRLSPPSTLEGLNPHSAPSPDAAQQ